MKLYINLIAQILSDGGKVLTYENIDTSFVMNKKTFQENISTCNCYFNNRLPDEYKYFLNQFNGGKLFYNDVGGFEIFGTNELIKENESQKAIYEEFWNEDIILFCELLGNGEYLGFKIYNDMKYEIVHSILGQKPNEWRIVDSSFDAFIETIIKERGKEYWLF
jgi:hypothetical protein